MVAPGVPGTGRAAVGDPAAVAEDPAAAVEDPAAAGVKAVTTCVGDTRRRIGGGRRGHATAVRQPPRNNGLAVANAMGVSMQERVPLRVWMPAGSGRGDGEASSFQHLATQRQGEG